MSTPAAKNNRYRRVTNPNGTTALAYSPHNKEAFIKWARKFNKPVLNRLLAGSGASYDKRIRKIPNPPHTRTAFIKAIIAKYLLNRNSQFPNATNAINNFHRAAKHRGENRISNARLVNYLATMPSNQLVRVHNSLPFYA